MYITFDHVNKSFGNFKASDDVSFGVEKGKLVALLGPSGSGKTTILRMLAGLEHQDSGNITIQGQVVNDLPVQARGIGFVFQSYALFPYYTVHDNIAYGVKIQKKSKQEIEQKVEELLNLVGLAGLGSRFPNQLSGGQKQRVAFARALAVDPQVLLLDEPFAAIDAKVRKELRRWLKDMIEQVGITSIFVTHDQDEAVEVADEIIITNQGRVEQTGTPIDIYQNPKTPFVAQFIGESVLLSDYSYTKLKGFEAVENADRAAIRPEFVKVISEKATPNYPSAFQKGVVEDTAFRGSYTELTINVNGLHIKAEYPIQEETIHRGDTVQVMISRMYAFDSENAYTLENAALKTKDMYYI
jgi:sulfate transport system ATP-binding protein